MTIFRKKGRCIGVLLYKLIKQQNQLNEKTRSLPESIETKEAPRCTCYRGSMTVEASIVVPFLAALFVFVLFFFRIMQTQLLVQQALEETGRKLSVYACVLEEETEHTGRLEVLANLWFFANLDRKAGSYVTGGKLGLNLMDSEFEGNDICLRVKYRVKFPVNLFGRKTFFLSQKTVWRKWTGWKDGGESPDGETWVYVAENGTVYHKTADCTHLSLSIHSVPVEQVEEYRNENGARFHPCNRCAQNGNRFRNVYITNYGDKYHTNLNCSGLRRSVEMVKKSEVGEKGACTRCWSS